MQDFPPNSAKAKARAEQPQTEERPPIEPVTTAGEVRRKRSLGRKFKNAFIEGTARGAVESMVGDVVIPTVKDMVFEAIQTGFERMIYGESRVRRGYAPPPSNLGYGGVPKVDYRGISSGRPPEPRSISRQSRERMNFGEIVIPSRTEAEEVLEQMYEILSRYDSVPVATLYALTGIVSSHTDHKWGWTSLRGARVAKLRDGRFVLDLPEPISLER